jgi:hypothetical protein
MDVATAMTLASGSKAAVTGFVVMMGGEAMLCDELLESFPPQCGGARMAVEGLAAGALGSVREAEGMAWTERPVTLSGEVRNGRLAVEP